MKLACQNMEVSPIFDHKSILSKQKKHEYQIHKIIFQPK